MSKEELEKVHFRIEKDEDDYPPVGVESVWARPTDDPSIWIVANIPFFALDIALYDVVLTKMEKGHRWFEKIIHHSGNSTFRIYFIENDALDNTKAFLERSGCTAEYVSQYGLLAVNVPRSSELKAIRDYLTSLEEQGKIEFEEGKLV